MLAPSSHVLAIVPSLVVTLTSPSPVAQAATMSTWKNVGMTYLKYSDLCATHLRNALKEPLKTQSKTLSDMHIRIMNWEDGKRGKPGARRPLPSPAKPRAKREAALLAAPTSTPPNAMPMPALSSSDASPPPCRCSLGFFVQRL